MAHQLEFERVVNYDPGQSGITLPAQLKLKEQTIDVQVKVDTGASCCIFERRLGEALGFSIETGLRQVFGTATGTFVAYGHEVTLSVADFEFKLSCWCSLVGTLSLTAVQELAHGPTDIASVRHHPLSL